MTKRIVLAGLVLALIVIPAAVFAARPERAVPGPYLVIEMGTMGKKLVREKDGSYAVSTELTDAVNRLAQKGYEPYLMSLSDDGSGVLGAAKTVVLIAKKRG